MAASDLVERRQYLTGCLRAINCRAALCHNLICQCVRLSLVLNLALNITQNIENTTISKTQKHKDYLNWLYWPFCDALRHGQF